ncbi:MAG TPA: phage tail tape measure protein [Pelagibacteraceae bacterium]|nr:phage tail tape measure protein [Pelagibacteraceae bacterium]
MKKKHKKKTRKRSRKIRKRKKHKLRKKVKHIKITKKTKKSRKIKKKFRKSGKRKKLKRRKKVKRIKITKKTKSLRTSKQLVQLKKLTVKKVLSLILQPFVKLYEDFKEKRKLKKLKQINFERKEKERQIKAEERLRKKMKEYEFQDEVRIARMRSHDLKRFIREEQAILRREQVNKRRRFLEDLKLEKKIELFRKRELEQIKRMERVALQEEREDYRPVLERLEKIKEKYRLIREQKIRERVKSLGLEVLDADTKEDLLQKQKAYEEHRQKIELVLESFYRSANSLVFQLNKRYIPKHKSILRVIDRRYEENLCFIRYDDNSDDDWLILIYLEDSNPAKETIIVEDKTNPEKHVTKSFQTRDIFAYSDYLVDQMTSHIDRERQKKAS